MSSWGVPIVKGGVPLVRDPGAPSSPPRAHVADPGADDECNPCACPEAVCGSDVGVLLSGVEIACHNCGSVATDLNGFRPAESVNDRPFCTSHLAGECLCHWAGSLPGCGVLRDVGLDCSQEGCLLPPSPDPSTGWPAGHSAYYSFLEKTDDTTAPPTWRFRLFSRSIITSVEIDGPEWIFDGLAFDATFQWDFEGEITVDNGLTTPACDEDPDAGPVTICFQTFHSATVLGTGGTVTLTPNFDCTQIPEDVCPDFPPCTDTHTGTGTGTSTGTGTGTDTSTDTGTGTGTTGTDTGTGTGTDTGTSTGTTTGTGTGAGGGTGVGDYIFARRCSDDSITGGVYSATGTTDGAVWITEDGSCVYARITDDRTTVSGPRVDTGFTAPSCSDCCVVPPNVPAGSWDGSGSPAELVFDGTVLAACAGQGDYTPDAARKLVWTPSENDWQSDDGTIYILFAGGGDFGYWEMTVTDSSGFVLWVGAKGGSGPAGRYHLECHECCDGNCGVLYIDVS